MYYSVVEEAKNCRNLFYCIILSVTSSLLRIPRDSNNEFSGLVPSSTDDYAEHHTCIKTAASYSLTLEVKCNVYPVP
jgi:hypothetical protein